MYRRVVTLKWTDVSEVCTTSIIRAMMETVRASETSAYFNESIRCYSREGYLLHNSFCLHEFAGKDSVHILTLGLCIKKKEL
jgi:hypothetical protein